LVVIAFVVEVGVLPVIVVKDVAVDVDEVMTLQHYQLVNPIRLLDC